MKLKILRQVTDQELDARGTEHFINASVKKNMSKELVDKLCAGIEKNRDELFVTSIMDLDNEAILEHIATTSIYMMFQLIQTSPQIKRKILKNLRDVREEMVLDVENVKEIPAMRRLLEKTSPSQYEDTQLIGQLLALTVQESIDDHGYRPYTQILLEGIPPLYRIVNEQNRYIKDSMDEQDQLIKHYRRLENISDDVTDDEIVYGDMYRYFIESDKADIVEMMAAKDQQEPAFDFQRIQDEFKRVENVHDTQRIWRQHLKHDKTEEYIQQYSMKEQYALGALIFVDSYLNLLSKSSYTFFDMAEISSYVRYSHLVNSLYNTKPIYKRIKNTKKKARPLKIGNNETFGELLTFHMLDDLKPQLWSTYIIHLYAQMNIRVDHLWNTVLSKKDIDTVTQMVTSWDDEFKNPGEELMTKDNEKMFFIVGLLTLALEKQQSMSEKEINETVIRMDKEQEKTFNDVVKKKDDEISRLKEIINKQNHALKRADTHSLRIKSLEDKLKWHDDMQSASNEIQEIEDNSSLPIDIDEIKFHLNVSDVLFIGGDVNWQQAMMQDLPEANFQLAEDFSKSRSYIETASIVIYNTATMNHGLANRFKNSLKRNTKSPIIAYLNSQSSNKEITYQRIGKQLKEKGLISDETRRIQDGD